MIELIVKSYFSILFAISASCLSILFFGVYLIFKRNAPVQVVQPREPILEAADINAIAGDDLFSTQLDLAKAFIESGKKHFARKILNNILEDGSSDQQREARVLLGQL